NRGPAPRTTGSVAPPPCGGATPTRPPTATGSPRPACTSTPNSSCPKPTAATNSSGPTDPKIRANFADNAPGKTPTRSELVHDAVDIGSDPASSPWLKADQLQ